MRSGWLLVIAGCGRVAFDPQARDDASLGASDANDAAALDARAASRCAALPGALHCDGFESPAISTDWLLFQTLGSVSIDTTMAYRGVSSLHSRTNAVPAGMTPKAEIRSDKGLMESPTPRELHVRVFAYFKSPMPADYNQFLTFSDTSGLGMGVATDTGVIANNDFTSIVYRESTTQLPLDRWVCLGFQVPSAQTGDILVYIDEQLISDITITKASAQPPPDHLYVGLDFQMNASGLPAVDAWFDEILIDDASVSCAD